MVAQQLIYEYFMDRVYRGVEENLRCFLIPILGHRSCEEWRPDPDFLAQVKYKIILIDGKRLSDLMIENSIGLSTVSTYHVKIIDSDYFEEG